ncbi:MAG TPA: hypothetical protein VMH26_19780 [Burkholderiales bacterium]|nr:hypothetical protein [Burkholderiales bacterium]
MKRKLQEIAGVARAAVFPNLSSQFLQALFNFADTGKPDNLPLVTFQAQ